MNDKNKVFWLRSASLLNNIKLYLLLIPLLSFIFILSCKKQNDDTISNSNSVTNYNEIISDAKNISSMHDSAISYMFNYPGYDNISANVRVRIANSYLIICGHRTDFYAEHKDVISNVLKGINFRDVNSVILNLSKNNIGTPNIYNYMKYIYSVLEMPNLPETKISLIGSYVDRIVSDNNLTGQEKEILIKYVILTKNSANNWFNLMTNKISTSKTMGKNDCNDCLSNNWGWLAAADGAGLIIGVLFGAPVEVALTFSAATTCALCPVCCEGTPYDPYYYPPCGGCPPGFVCDGANCWLFTPPAGSNPWIGNGYFYWDDPLQKCVPPGPPAFWDGAHCAFKIPTDHPYFPFIYHGGFYIKAG